MKIALDYDDTFTRDTNFWLAFIALVNTYGHTVEIVTKRGVSNQGETVPDYGIPVNYTDRKPKLQYMESIGKHFDIWIDDSPINLFREG